MDLDTMEGLLEHLDLLLVKRERSYDTLDKQYKNEKGLIPGKDYDEYKERKDRIESRFRCDAIECQRRMDELCKKIRGKQPVLTELTAEHLNRKGRFPRRIALGKYRVRYENLDIYVPKMFEFPFRKPMYICDNQQMVLLHKVILRLMYALPSGKQEYYIFDPIGLGKSMWRFNRLFQNETLFPQRKVMVNAGELKAALKSVMDYMQNLYSHTFDLQTDCRDWDSYNRRLYSQKNLAKMLPYKVFIFMDVPDGMDPECFEMFRKLLLHSEECGFLVLYSFNEVLLEAEDSRRKAQELQLKQCIESSLPLHSVLDKDIADASFAKLKRSSIGEKFPEDGLFYYLLDELDQAIKRDSKSMFSFEEMLGDANLFSRKSTEKLLVPCGYTTTGALEVVLDMGDRYPHYLIGGTTGSGKSNLLHNIIMNACWNYSPRELRVYLLDFKEGVEFSRYAAPLLKHASLVATEADTEYGISVLRHLEQEKTRRYSLFKRSGCKDIRAFREKNPAGEMPRLLVVVDEFQLLLEGPEKESAVALLSVLTKQGRACGIHLVLATQSLKGIDFGSLAPQFSGRIALKSSAEDSKLLLGGITSNNEAAAELEIPFAILNTAQGAVAGNVKYAVPEAKPDVIEEKITAIADACEGERIHTLTKIFEGQRFPALPGEDAFVNPGVELLLGENMDYDADFLRIALKDSAENNLLICGHDGQMKRDFLQAILLSAAGSAGCEEVIYIGDDPPEGCGCAGRTISVLSYPGLQDFIADKKEEYFGKRRLLIFDNTNFAKEVGFPVSTYPKPSEDTLAFKEFWDMANKYGNHFVAFYEGMNRLKAGCIPAADFGYRVGYSLNADEKNQFLNNTAYGSKEARKGRAFFADNLTIKAWFRPFE